MIAAEPTSPAPVHTATVSPAVPPTSPPRRRNRARGTRAGRRAGGRRARAGTASGRPPSARARAGRLGRAGARRRRPRSAPAARAARARPRGARTRGRAPASRTPRPHDAREEERADDGPDCTRQRPARHVVLAARGLEVHQRRLRERDERARGRVEEAERDQQHPEGRRARGECERRGEDGAPTSTRARAPGHGEDAEHRLDDGRDDRGDGEQEPDLGVRQRQVVADQRPRGLAGTEDELVEELDGEQRHDDAAERPTDQELPGRVHSRDCTPGLGYTQVGLTLFNPRH